MLYLPVVLASLADAFVATGRIGKFLTSEELGDPYMINANHDLALDVDGDFTWERVGKPADSSSAQADKPSSPGALGDASANKKQKLDIKSKADKAPSSFLNGEKDSTGDEVKTDEDTPTDEEQPFTLNGLRLKVAKGAFVAIVGPIGSGKVCWCLLQRTKLTLDRALSCKQPLEKCGRPMGM